MDAGLGEPVDQGVLGLVEGKPTALKVEELLGVDLPDRGAVGATHVVGLDLELGDGIGLGVRREDQRSVRLVGV